MAQMSSATQSSQTAALALSLSLSSALFSSFSRSLLLLSFSLTALSYALCSSVLFGARTPNAPAIILAADAVVFSGRTSAPPSRAPPVRRVLDAGVPRDADEKEKDDAKSGSSCIGAGRECVV